jgi:hypothetical protein
MKEKKILLTSPAKAIHIPRGPLLHIQVNPFPPSRIECGSFGANTVWKDRQLTLSKSVELPEKNRSGYLPCTHFSM